MLGALLGMNEIPESERVESDSKKSKAARKAAKAKAKAQAEEDGPQPGSEDPSFIYDDENDPELDGADGGGSAIDTKFAYLAFVFSCVWGVGGNVSLPES